MTTIATIVAIGMTGTALTACAPDTEPTSPSEERPTAAQPGEPTTDSPLDEIRRLYEEALEFAPDDPVEWTKQDLEKIGDWEYRVVVIEKNDVTEIEMRLNELGAERWEVFWVSESRSELTVYLKKPARSYLRMVPLSDIGKAIGDASSYSGK